MLVNEPGAFAAFARRNPSCTRHCCGRLSEVYVTLDLRGCGGDRREEDSDREGCARSLRVQFRVLATVGEGGWLIKLKSNVRVGKIGSEIERSWRTLLTQTCTSCLYGDEP